jgi:hypothetical protein
MIQGCDHSRGGRGTQGREPWPRVSVPARNATAPVRTGPGVAFRIVEGMRALAGMKEPGRGASTGLRACG